MPSESTIVIRHLAHLQPHQFEVQRLGDGLRTEPVKVASPREGEIDLLAELRWYLEDFLEYPYPPETDRAERALRGLRAWGEGAFNALFGGRRGGRLFDVATADGYSALNLQIASDDTEVLSWPWEALRDPEIGVELANACKVERRLNQHREPGPLPNNLSTDTLNILLVVCRPYGEQDVRYRSVARPLVDLVEHGDLPVKVEMLRPPTFSELRDHLRRNSGRYHVLHFDGHGTYPSGPVHGPVEGSLVFETEHGQPDEIRASDLSALLRECSVPVAVLNACRSAMIGGATHDPFGSVAASLLRAGIRSVTAMSYNLYVSGAQVFLPAFYKRLFDEGSVGPAVLAGRQKMREDRRRLCSWGRFELQDWLLPTLYQQGTVDFGFLRGAEHQKPKSILGELRERLGSTEVIGRDRQLLELERAFRRKPSGILIQGLGGIGKTTLALTFLDWLEKTGGMAHSPFWFGFDEIRSAAYVIDEIGSVLFGAAFHASGELQGRAEALARHLRSQSLVIVWDNFESAVGIEGTSVKANLPPEDQTILVLFLKRLIGGRTKVLITSRSPETWLPQACRYRLQVPGLDGDERWELCASILGDLGIPFDPDNPDPQLKALMDMLGGHPLAIRAILPLLEEKSAESLIEALKASLKSLALTGNQASEQVLATLKLVLGTLPDSMSRLLAPLAFHERYVDSRIVEVMLADVLDANANTDFQVVLGYLSKLGLARRKDEWTWELHPILPPYLKDTLFREDDHGELRTLWAKAFVNVVARGFANLAPEPQYRQKYALSLHRPNLENALSLATELGLDGERNFLLQNVGVASLQRGEFDVARRCFDARLQSGKARNDREAVATALHQLGALEVAQESFEQAESFSIESAEVAGDLGDAAGAAAAYQQASYAALRRGHYEKARSYLQQSEAAVSQTDEAVTKQAIEQGFADLALQEGKPTEAYQGACTALKSAKAINRSDRVAAALHTAGKAALRMEKFEAARQNLLQAVDLYRQIGHEVELASCLHDLGMTYSALKKYQFSKDALVESLRISKKQGDRRREASAYQHLGLVEYNRGEPGLAKSWFTQAADVANICGASDINGLASGMLGVLAESTGDLVSAARFYLVAIKVFASGSDQERLDHNMNRLVQVVRRADDRMLSKLDDLFERNGCRFRCQDIRSNKELNFAIEVRKRGPGELLDSESNPEG